MSQMKTSRGQRRAVTTAALLLAALSVAWAITATVSKAPEVDSESSHVVYVEARQMSLGRSLNLNVTVTQPFVTGGFNDAEGKVTSLSSERIAAAGTVLYTVNARPVVSIEGNFPFYRDLQTGESGEDVREFRTFLGSQGYKMSGAGDIFNWSVNAATRQWQKTLGVTSTGVVSVGDVIAIQGLPRPFRFPETVTVGSMIGTGPVILVQSGAAAFALNVSEDQASLIPADATVAVRYKQLSWPAVISSRDPGDPGNIAMKLSSPDGGEVCASECASLPPDENIVLDAAVVLVPVSTGTAVPVSAIHEDRSGKLYVLAATGRKTAVRVLGSDGGFAVIDGLKRGTKVVASSTPRNDTVPKK